MTFYKKAKQRLPHTNWSDIVVEVLQKDTLEPFLFMNCQDFVVRTSIDIIKDISLEVLLV